MLEDPAKTELSVDDEDATSSEEAVTEVLDRSADARAPLPDPARTEVDPAPAFAPAPVELPALAAERDPARAFVGRVIGGYRVGELIGRGGSGLVYVATRVSDGEEVALKIISPDASGSPHLQRAKRETTVQASLRHRNIVAVYAFGQEGERWYLASELVEGGPLSRKLREAGPLPTALVALVLRDLLAGVEYAHDSSVIHRDIKPANVLLTTDGRSKLADFGLARSLYDPFRTTPGIVMGTPQYMSPEQVGEGEVDHRADFFSIATVAYEMVSGTSPFKDTSPVRSMLAVAHGERPPLVEAAPAVLPLLEDLIEHLGARDPEQRPEKAGVVLDRIDPLAYAAERLFPDAGARFVAEPRATAQRLRREEAKLELERAEQLRALGPAHISEAAFAAWRATALDESNLEALALRERLGAENGYRFRANDDPRAHALERALEGRPRDESLLRETVALYRAEGNLPMLARRLRRLVRVAPADNEARASLVELAGDPMGPFKRR